jgi:hypothetical protein
LQRFLIDKKFQRFNFLRKQSEFGFQMQCRYRINNAGRGLYLLQNQSELAPPERSRGKKLDTNPQKILQENQDRAGGACCSSSRRRHHHHGA